MKTSGLIQTGKIRIDAAAQPIKDFGKGSGQYVAGTMPFKLRIDRVDDSPYQPRTVYKPDAIAELAGSIAAAGQLEPIKVRPKADGRYELISGHRRRRAVELLGELMIDAYIVSVDDAEAQRATMLANEARENLTDYERAKLYQHALSLGIVATQEECARYFGTSQATVSRCLAMLALPPMLLADLEEDPARYSATDAKAIQRQMSAPIPEEKPAKAPPIKRVPSVITGEDKKPVFTARSSGREISIRINDASIDSVKAREIILSALQEFVNREKNVPEIQ